MPKKKGALKKCLNMFFETAKSRKRDLTEEDLRAHFIKTDILGHLGYTKIGEDIRLERAIHKKRKRPDIQCLDEYGNVVFVVEFKKPSEATGLRNHLTQLWDSYVIPLKAQYGILTNGLSVIVYQRIGLNPHSILEKSVGELDEKDCQLIQGRLQKPSYDMTNVKRVNEYFREFTDPNEMRPLDTELARELFFEDFALREGSLFSNLVQGTIELLDYQYEKSTFLTSAYDFWKKSYAKKPDKIPKSWRRFIGSPVSSTSDEDLYKFMFCLETTYALFTRLVLAKACEDYKFPHINFNEFLSQMKGFRGEISLVSWGILLTQWIENMRDSLVESVFEEDIFYWWTDKFNEMRTWETWELFSPKLVSNELMPFCECLADVMFTLYKYDFSRIAGDPLGDLYQRYFDRETRKALGEFYTPRGIVSYILDAVEYNGQFVTDKRLLDPACGSGTFLVEALNRYLDASTEEAVTTGWGGVLRRLCNEFHIVGFDIHPFATIMAQIRFMLVLIPYYKKAVESERTFVLRRIPIFRTDSLVDERKSKKQDIMSFVEGVRNVQLKIALPIKKKIEDKEFIEIEVTMPRTQEVWNKTDLKNVPEYFCALQAVFDTVKYQARNEEYTIDKDLIERRLKEYLDRKKWRSLVGFFIPYANQILNTIKDLKYRFGDGRLVKSVEDVMLAGLLKNYVEYDYVVGNPPYVRVQMIDTNQKRHYESVYETAKGLYDLYCLFVEKGINLLAKNGRFGYITSNKFMARGYGESLRGFIADNSRIDQIIDFGDSGVFQDVTNYPCILILTKEKNVSDNLIKCVRVAGPTVTPPSGGAPEDAQSNTTLAEIEDKIRSARISTKEYDIFEYDQSALTPSRWELMPSEEKNVMEKMLKRTNTKLGDTIEEIGVGIQTSADKVFVIGRELKERLGLEDEVTKKFLYGKNVKKWQILWEDHFVIYPYQNRDGVADLISEDDLRRNFPKTHKYLAKYKSKLLKRWGIKVWYELSTKRSYSWFRQPKILIAGTSHGSNFAFDSDGFFYPKGGGGIFGLVLGRTMSAKDDYLYILGLLNSRALDFYFKHISPMLSGKYYTYHEDYLKELPLRLPSSGKDRKLSRRMVDKVKEITVQREIRRRTRCFPDEYLLREEPTELGRVSYTFKANHKSLKPSIVELVDGGFGVAIGKKESNISAETKAKSHYICAAIEGKNFKKGGKIEFRIPKDDSVVVEAVKRYNADIERLEKTSALELEEEIDELVYTLYGLDEEDSKVIGSFLEKFQ